MAEMNGQMNPWKNYLITKQKMATTKKKLPLKASLSTFLDWKQKNAWKIEVNILEGRDIFLVDLLNYI